MGTKDEVKHTCRWQVVTQPCPACTAVEDACVREVPTMGAYARDAQGAKDRDVRAAPPAGAPLRMDSGYASGVMRNVGYDSAGVARFASSLTDRTFTRAEVLVVLKSRKATLDTRPFFAGGVAEVDMLITIFERME